MSQIVVQGVERVRLERRIRGLHVRWWLFVHLDGEDGRPQGPRQGVADGGFVFARGGRVATEDEAELALAEARREAVDELWLWRGQPSHALGPAGNLIPLGLQELPA